MSPIPWRWRRAARQGADQAASDADQTAADADQTASDADQGFSERDQAAAEADQKASDRDQAAADRELRAHPSGDTALLHTHKEARAEREEDTVARRVSGALRAQIAAERDEQAKRRDDLACDRDRTAEERDRAAELADQEAERLAREVGDADPQIKAALEAAAKVRIRASATRARAAADRERAAKDREAAARDRDLLHREIERSHLDELTGAYRRGMGEVLLRHEIERARRSRGKLAIAFIDVDELKQTNDRYGHPAGDAVLREVFAALKARLRPYDPIVRWGGDEFVCSIACSVLESARQRLEEARLDLVKSHPGISISAGVATLEDADTLVTLIERADGAMLQAKRDS
jgi:diguanylate cyclase (GGDEF)-like protein